MTPAQLERRRASLGASEVAAVCGLDPFKTKLDVWGSKMGWLSQDDSDAADLGNLLEPVILQRYANKTGQRLHKVETMFGSEPWISATPDALNDRLDLNVQAKAVGRYMAHHWDDGVPEYVQLQCQWEMMVSGIRRTDVAALICITDFRIIPIDRDDTLIDNILTICRAFWFQHVAAGVMPELDGSETATAILRAMYQERGGMVQADAELIELATRHQAQAVELDALEESHKALRNQIRKKVGAATGAEWPGGRIIYKTTKAGERPLLVRTT